MFINCKRKEKGKRIQKVDKLPVTCAQKQKCNFNSTVNMIKSCYALLMVIIIYML